MDQRIQAAEHKTQKQLEEQLKPVRQKEDVTALKEQICDLSVENEKLKKELLEAQTSIAFLQSKLSALRNDYADNSLNSTRFPPEFQCSHGGQESSWDDASDTDASCIWDEETYGTKGVASIVGRKPPRCVSKGSAATPSRKLISALPSQDKESKNPKAPRSRSVYRIVLAGDAAVGKTSFLMRFCKNEFQGDISTTIGVDCKMKTLIVDGEETVLQLWDTAGLERFGIISKSYFRKASGVLLLYDITCERSFLNVREWLTMIEDASPQIVPIMLVGNKSDLRDTAASEGQKCVPRLFGENLARNYGALFCETSAKDGSNIVEAVLHIAREVKKRPKEEADSNFITILAGTSSRESVQRKNCCSA
ncbi:ras and EF-hand domain-containing protein [Octodon degus]|uniref:Ras and EF-hand domain-containing protein n=1 Tax=Octodon degus TaxID=10160 RepID=A0A6P6DCE5_OCTDE|nr:ras and EF-hand domain-containing protein [Octodon degus]